MSETKSDNNFTYICIDLKSFYASVECVERGLDPFTTNLVVADPERTDKTICLAITPAMKAMGIKNRCRVFEIPSNVDFIMAPPRMQKYIDYAAEIYGIYLRYASKDDIHVYSIDEAFIDVSRYIKNYGMNPRDLARKIMDEIYNELGIRATAGVGTNLYLTKIALDILAKHSPDFIGYLDEDLYKEILWNHRPLSDFWRIGKRTEHKLAEHGIYTMEQIAKANEDFLYKLFGVDAELLIDHANGIEPTTIADIKQYKPMSESISSGQVLMRDYSKGEGRVIVNEMAEGLALDLTKKSVSCGGVAMQVGYAKASGGEFVRGSFSFDNNTNLASAIIPAALEIYDRICDDKKMIRRLTIACYKIENYTEEKQFSLWDQVSTKEEMEEENLQETIVALKKKFGKNAMLKGIDFTEPATARQRNGQIGGHKSGE
ncbi:MAG: DNA repair protein [Clostridia bacterium]|nr:DNA repair protein [Clostridia bacterium]